jgi:hypothetical protein
MEKLGVTEEEYRIIWIKIRFWQMMEENYLNGDMGFNNS